MKFAVKGHHIEISYTPGSTPGLTTLTYKDDSLSRGYTKDEVHTDSTALGSLVSISLNPKIMPLEGNTDGPGITFAFLLPEDIDVPHGQTKEFTTVAIREERPVLHIQPPPPTTWHTFVMHGTAQNITTPL